MATTIIPHSSNVTDRTTAISTKTLVWAAPIGRLFLSLIFILSGFNHFSSETIQYAINAGVDYANFLVPASGILAIVGGLSVATGFRARFGAFCLIAFLVPVTLMMHNFWSPNDPAMAEMQMVHFMKNISMLGGAFLILFYGSGPKSVDYH